MKESEKITRKTRIDCQLKASPLGWSIIPWSKDLDTSVLEAHAVKRGHSLEETCQECRRVFFIFCIFFTYRNIYIVLRR